MRLRNICFLVLILMSCDPSADAQKTVVSDPYRQGRSMVMSQHGMVASSHPLATLAGIDILRDGGNAMDAAVAVAATLGVVEPPSIGIGGDAWFLYYEAQTGKVYALNGSGRSPMNLARSYFDTKSVQEIEETTWEAVTVPGAVDAYAAGIERFGNLTLSDVLQPAIRYAEDGFPVTEIVGTIWFTQVGRLYKDPWSRETWLKDDGTAPATGEVFRVPALAKTLRLIAEGGRDAFYEGPIAEEIVRYANESGGWLTMDDFGRHRSEWVEPVSTTYRGYDVFQCPPNGQGSAVLMMLNILEGYDLGAIPFNSPQYVHLMIEAKKLAYADVHRFFGDPARGDIPVERLLSKAYAADRRKLIDPNKAMPEPDPSFPQGGDTAYMTVVDSEGNACSFINSLFAPFGTGITGGSTGVLLQNRGSGFTLEEGHFNDYAPGVRPFHTIIPGMVLKDGKLYLSYGLMGGAMQPQGHVQLLCAHIDHGLNLQEAIDVPRWRHMDGKTVRLEQGTPDELWEGLEALGHDLQRGHFLLFGSAQAIKVDPETSVYVGASDSRRDGLALGW